MLVFTYALYAHTVLINHVSVSRMYLFSDITSHDPLVSIAVSISLELIDFEKFGT